MEKLHTAYTSTENQRASVAGLKRIPYGKLIVKCRGKTIHKTHTHGKSTGYNHARDGKSTRKALRESTRKALRDCVEYMDGIIILDIRKNIEYISPSE